jgi:hypothetical protein
MAARTLDEEDEEEVQQQDRGCHGPAHNAAAEE